MDARSIYHRVLRLINKERQLGLKMWRKSQIITDMRCLGGVITMINDVRDFSFSDQTGSLCCGGLRKIERKN